MKYRANPIIVDAHIITATGPIAPAGGMLLGISNGTKVVADKGMIARYIPVEGDYLVTQPDGYFYINPKDVFEKKYTPLPEDEEQKKIM